MLQIYLSWSTACLQQISRTFKRGGWCDEYAKLVNWHVVYKSGTTTSLCGVARPVLCYWVHVFRWMEQYTSFETNVSCVLFLRVKSQYMNNMYLIYTERLEVYLTITYMARLACKWYFNFEVYSLPLKYAADFNYKVCGKFYGRKQTVDGKYHVQIEAY